MCWTLMALARMCLEMRAYKDSTSNLMICLPTCGKRPLPNLFICYQTLPVMLISRSQNEAKHLFGGLDIHIGVQPIAAVVLFVVDKI